MRLTCLTGVGKKNLLAVLLAGALLAPAAPAQDIGFERDRMKMMLESVSKDIEKHFYDPTLRGLDWKALTRQTEIKIEQADNVGEMITAIFSLVEKLGDSHTQFLPPTRTVRVRFGFQAKPFGDEVRIYELEKDGPAAKAGLERGDRIWAVNGFTAKRNTWDLMMLYFRVLRPVAVMEIHYSRGNERPRKLRVEADVEQGGARLDLTKGRNIYQLIREAENERQPFLYNTLVGGIGYLHLPFFTADTSFLQRLVDEVKKSRAVIVDLRGNPGGAVKGLERMIEFFTPEETVVARLVQRDDTEPLEVEPRKPRLTGPLFILVDSQSASAAEIFARHFQRTGQAKVIGDRTSGRVTLARFYDHHIGQDIVVPYGVQVAVGRVVFPDGEELERAGVEPDVSCIPDQEALRRNIDTCKAMALLLARRALGLETEKEKEE